MGGKPFCCIEEEKCLNIILWDTKIRQVGDLFDCSRDPPRLYKCQELNMKYSMQLDFFSYNKIRKSSNAAAGKLNNKIYDPTKSD